ncbi:MAG TPA: DUF2244 domain-containing protein [Devosia sp.]|jgi:uncharacterized membrane protein|uniref:DUF2244 domain-containing protein n=1 Tax=Devosia sp. TaxID=1871048 RepID=UPI002F93F967
MPMQATTTTPLFSAALRPDRAPGIVGGWVGLGAATLMALPFAVLVPEVLLPAGTAFLAGSAGMTALSVRQSRRRSMRQQVTLWPDQLEVVTSHGKGERKLRRFDPKTVRLVLERDSNEKAVAMRLRQGQSELEIGAFLSVEDRASFAKAFGTALRRARRTD